MRPLRCTRSASAPVCQLLWRLEACNQLLSHIGFQLREKEEDGTGELRPVLTPRPAWRAAIRIGARSRAAMDLSAPVRGALVRILCVRFVELDYDVAKYEVLLAAARESVGVRRLFIYNFHNIPRGDPGLFDGVLELITSTDHVDEMVFHKRQHRSIYSVPLPSFSLSAVEGITLRKLNVVDLNLRDSEVSKLITLLMGNDTVTELAVGTSVCTFAGTETSLGFADYLAKAKGTLRSLTLRSGSFCSTPDRKRLANTIAAMKTLGELVVDMLPCGSEGTDIFAEVLTWSTTLRHLSVVLPQWWDRSMFYDTTVLETLTLDLLGFFQEECRMLFLALAENQSIRRMTVHRLIERGCVESTCRMIREYGLAEQDDAQVAQGGAPREHFGEDNGALAPAGQHVHDKLLKRRHGGDGVGEPLHVGGAAEIDRPEGEAAPGSFRLGQVIGEAQRRLRPRKRVHRCPDGELRHGVVAHEQRDQLNWTPRDLLSGHNFDYSVLTALAAYMAGPNQLKEVEVHFYAVLYNERNTPHDRAESPLIKAASSNPNLSKLTLSQLRLSGADCPLLADGG
ncbi:hypothetical protein HPB49_013769 [Dermacentor silvarum]|uniref:Uncharacterized protein n=1 Tax=Dermacentor silvarum TaxID=543639 RepID=A0ACB8E0Z3_DERSI|nr:hypothetical protein HPB49_013769 [Dermacentor silvarum]